MEMWAGDCRSTRVTCNKVTLCFACYISMGIWATPPVRLGLSGRNSRKTPEKVNKEYSKKASPHKFVVVAFPNKSVFGQFSSLPSNAQPPQKRCLLAVSELCHHSCYGLSGYNSHWARSRDKRQNRPNPSGIPKNTLQRPDLPRMPWPPHKSSCVRAKPI